MHKVRTILVIDDEASIRESLEMFLREKGLVVYTASTGAEGLQLWHDRDPQVVILDIRLPDISGLEVLREISAGNPDVKVIMITAYHDMETTIEAMRHGAYDYIHKPLDVDELDRAVTMSRHIAAASHRNPPILHQDDSEEESRYRILGRTPQMRDIFKMIGLLSRNRATVLIEGETGTGKDLIARVMHESSNFKKEPFVTVDCTTLVDSLTESELFGHARGAFTGAVEAKRGRLELAGEGTVFFDEIGELPLLIQAKLLRFLENREFTRVGGTQMRRCSARIIAATNRDLDDLARKGRFRHDLLYRLKVISIHVPPLRERRKDIPDLVKCFIAGINRELHTKVTRVEDEAMQILFRHSWPGNLRELKNVLTKAVLHSRANVLLADAVQDAIASSPPDLPAAAGSLTLEEMEKQHIFKAMAHSHGNISAAARALGVSRPTLRKRLKRYDVYRSESEKSA
jgi:two-component system response regulator AtoC